MKRFKTNCVDTKTGYTMVLSEASYNESCQFLTQFLKETGFLIHAKPVDNMKKLKFQKHTFYYDEERGYLMQKD